MADWLGSVCQSIPPEFFLDTYDRRAVENTSRRPFMSVNQIRESASRGCVLCAFLTARMSAPFIESTSSLTDHPTTLARRDRYDYQAFVLSVGAEETSGTYFF